MSLKDGDVWRMSSRKPTSQSRPSFPAQLVFQRRRGLRKVGGGWRGPKYYDPPSANSASNPAGADQEGNLRVPSLRRAARTPTCAGKAEEKATPAPAARTTTDP